NFAVTRLQKVTSASRRRNSSKREDVMGARNANGSADGISGLNEALALPQMRGAVSTLAHEVTLAAACLKIVPAGRAGLLAGSVGLAAELNDLLFPPMV